MLPWPPQITLMDADAFAHNEEAAPVVLEVSRATVESGEIGSVIERLLVLTDSQENMLRYQGQVRVLVTGYEDDLRELPVIPEVRALFVQITKEWPYWLWFLAIGEGQLPLMALFLCEGTLYQEGGSLFCENLDEAAVRRQAQRLMEGTFGLAEGWGISPELTGHRVKLALDDMMAAFDPEGSGF